MLLRGFSTDIFGERVHPEDDFQVEVASREEATAVLAEKLVATATDEFLHEALVHWFTRGAVQKLHEGGEIFWSVELDMQNDED